MFEELAVSLGLGAVGVGGRGLLEGWPNSLLHFSIRADLVLAMAWHVHALFPGAQWPK